MGTRGWIRLSAASLLIFAAIVATQGILVAAFDPARQQISEYAHSPAGATMVVGFLAWSLSMLTLAGSTLAVNQGGRGGDRRLTRLQAVALVAAAVGVALLAIFPTDRGSEVPAIVTQATVGGQVHDGASALATLAITAAALAGAFRRSGWVRSLTLALLLTAFVSSAAFLAVGDPVPGIRQRLLVLAACVWQGAWLLGLRSEVAATSPQSSVDSRCSTS